MLHIRNRDQAGATFIFLTPTLLDKSKLLVQILIHPNDLHRKCLLIAQTVSVFDKKHSMLKCMPLFTCFCPKLHIPYLERETHKMLKLPCFQEQNIFCWFHLEQSHISTFFMFKTTLNEDFINSWDWSSYAEIGRNASSGPQNWSHWTISKAYCLT